MCDIVSKYLQNAVKGSDDFPVNIRTLSIDGTDNIANNPLNFPTNKAK